MSKVVIFGTGSFAEVAQFLLERDSEHEVVAFTVHESYVTQREIAGLPVVPFEQLADQFPPDAFAMLVAVGYKNVNQLRASIYAEAKSKGYQLISYVSSRCTNWGQSIGDNCFIFEDNTIQPFVTIGNNVTLWSGNHIGHDATIEDHCFITSHVVVSGYVRIGTRSFIGVNATLRNSITIAPRTLIGAGAIIMKDTKPNEVYMPERAKLFAKSSDEIDL